MLQKVGIFTKAIVTHIYGKLETTLHASENYNGVGKLIYEEQKVPKAREDASMMMENKEEESREI